MMVPEGEVGQAPEEVIAEPDAGSQQQPQQTGDNPSWASYVKEFPEQLQGMARDTFKKWDADVQGQFTKIHEQYRPFKSYIDNKVDPAKLDQAYALANQLESDPEQFARLLAGHLGLTIEEAKQAVADVAEPDNSPDANSDFARLQQRQDELVQMFQQQEDTRQQEALTSKYTKQIEDEIGLIESTYGKMTDPVRDAVLEHAYARSVATNREVSLPEAYQSLNTLITQATQARSTPRPGATAPRMVPAGNTVPTVPDGKSLGTLTDKETRDMAAAVISAHVHS